MSIQPFGNSLGGSLPAGGFNQFQTTTTTTQFGGSLPGGFDAGSANLLDAMNRAIAEDLRRLQQGLTIQSTGAPFPGTLDAGISNQIQNQLTNQISQISNDLTNQMNAQFNSQVAGLGGLDQFRTSATTTGPAVAGTGLQGAVNLDSLNFGKMTL